MGVYIQQSQSTSHPGPPQSSWSSDWAAKPGPVLFVSGCRFDFQKLKFFFHFSCFLENYIVFFEHLYNFKSHLNCTSNVDIGEMYALESQFTSRRYFTVDRKC